VRKQLSVIVMGSIVIVDWFQTPPSHAALSLARTTF
jgi:hypothetical protein